MTDPDDLITLSKAAKLTKLSFAVFNSAAAEGRIHTMLRGSKKVSNREGLGQANVPKHYLTRAEAFRYAEWFRNNKESIQPFTTKSPHKYRTTDDDIIAASARHAAELHAEAKACGIPFSEYKQLCG